MKEIIYNASTEETSIVEVPDIILEEIYQVEPTLEERIAALEKLELERIFNQ